MHNNRALLLAGHELSEQACDAVNGRRVDMPRRRLMRSMVMVAWLMSGCSLVSTAKTMTGPPPTTTIFFYAPPLNGLCTYIFNVSGGSYGGTVDYPATRDPSYDSHPSRPGTVDPAWVAYSCALPFVNGVTYDLELNYKSVESGLVVTPAGSASFTMDNDTEELFQ